jgi:ribosome-binding protein aMBF1 (putative translation factor)
MSTVKKEICSKCGREIAPSEMAYVVDGGLICVECDRKLQSRSTHELGASNKSQNASAKPASIHRASEKETCTKCGREIPRPKQAYIFNGEIVCGECDGKLRSKSVVAPASTKSNLDRVQAETLYKGVRGWLMLLCISLTIVNPIVGGGLAMRQIWLLESQKGNLLREMSDEAYFKYTFPLYIDPIVTIGLIVFGFIAGLSLWTLEIEGVKQALSFLNWVLYWTVIRGIIFSRFYEMKFDDIVYGVAGPIIYYLIWSIYLKKSKRVRVTYPSAFSNPNNETDINDG